MSDGTPELSTGGAVDDIAVGVCAAVAYGFTLAPEVSTGDSGELVTAAATLSLAHPTGYPLYLLLGHVFIRALPMASAAVAMNVFSAVAAVGAVVVTRRIANEMTGDRLTAAATALLFAASASQWGQATVARVYALGALLMALGVLELVKLTRQDPGASLARGWLWFGLGMANHTVSLVLAPLLAYATWRAPVSWARRLALAAVAIPGLSLYLYIPIAAAAHPVQNWGDPSTPARLLAYLSRESFWNKRHVRELADVPAVVAHYLAEIPAELTWLGAGLAALGCGAALRRRDRLVALVLYLFVANVALMIWHGSRQDIFYWSRYLLTGWLALGLVAGVGLRAATARVRPTALRVALLLTVPAFAFAAHYSASDRSGDRYARKFSEQILRELEPGALLIAEEDNVVFALSYLHHVEGLRPDVTLAMQGINALSSMAIQPDQTPTYFTHHHDLGQPGLVLVPDGLVLRLVAPDSGFEGRDWRRGALPWFERPRDPSRGRYLDRSLVGNYFFMKALNLERDDPDAAMEAARRSAEISHDNAVNLVNAGLLFERNARFESAAEAFARAYALDPRNDLAAERAVLWTELQGAARGAPPDQRAGRIASRAVALGRSDLAELFLQGAVRVGPTSFDLYYNLAALRIGRGAYAEALEPLELALALDPGSKKARRDLDQVRHILGL